MKKYIITNKEWEDIKTNVLNLQKANQRLLGVIEGIEKAFSLHGINISVKKEELIKFKKQVEFNYERFEMLSGIEHDSCYDKKGIYRYVFTSNEFVDGNDLEFFIKEKTNNETTKI